MLQSHEDYTNSATFFQFQDSKSPVSPVAPPELHAPQDSTTAGVYTIDLTQAMPYHDSTTARSEDEPNGVIFRVQDIQSGNMTYIQLVHFTTLQMFLCVLYFCKLCEFLQHYIQSLSLCVDWYKYTSFVEVETEAKLTSKHKVVKYHHKINWNNTKFLTCKLCSTVSLQLLCTTLCSCWLPCV